MKQSSLGPIALVGLCLLAGACANNKTGLDPLEPGKTLRITEEAWSALEEYRRLIGGQRTGAFVVAMMGDIGVGGIYTYCEKGSDRCRSQGAAGPVNQALDACKEQALDCVLFARNDTIVVDYQIAK